LQTQDSVRNRVPKRRSMIYPVQAMMNWKISTWPENWVKMC